MFQQIVGLGVPTSNISVAGDVMVVNNPNLLNVSLKSVIRTESQAIFPIPVFVLFLLKLSPQMTHALCFPTAMKGKQGQGGVKQLRRRGECQIMRSLYDPCSYRQLVT